MKTTFADVEPNPAIVCVVGPAAVVTFPFNSRQAAVGGAVLAPGGGFLPRAPCPSYNPNPNTSTEFPLGVSLAWYFVHWDRDHVLEGIVDEVLGPLNLLQMILGVIEGQIKGFFFRIAFWTPP